LRLSSERPWLVTHTVSPNGNSAEQEIWGVDTAGLSPEATHREGLEAVVSLPAAKLLGRGPIEGDMVRNVPRYAPGDPIPDPNRRAESIVAWAIEQLATALEKDIQGAKLIVRVGDATPERGEARDR
jgi:hypothetical protein